MRTAQSFSTHALPDNRIDGERSGASRSQIHESTMVREPPISEQPRKQLPMPGMPGFGSQMAETLRCHSIAIGNNTPRKSLII